MNFSSNCTKDLRCKTLANVKESSKIKGFGRYGFNYAEKNCFANS